MRNLPLMTGAALIALAGSAFASPPPSNIENVQVNVGSVNAAQTKVKHVGASLLDATTQAVGNTLSVTDTADHTSANVNNLQVNDTSIQSAKTGIKSVELEGASGSLTVNTAAVGNNASISTTAFDTSGNSTTGDDTGIAVNSFQLNNDAVQLSTTTVKRSDIDGPISVSTVAVGNNLSVDAADGGINPNSGLFGQTNNAVIQDAETVISVPYGDGQHGPINVSTQAVGNNASFNAGEGNVNFALAGQSNTSAIQVANTNITGVHSLSGSSSIDTVAAGNNLNLTADGKVDVKGGAFSGQWNTGAITTQTANTTLKWSSFGGSLDVTTAALGNSANVSATDSATLGGAGILGDDYHQINGHTIQAAFTTIGHVGVGGDLNVTTAAVGNNLSLVGGGTANLDAIQVNSDASQLASTSIGHSTIGGGLTVNTQAIGNAASVSVK